MQLTLSALLLRLFVFFVVLVPASGFTNTPPNFRVHVIGDSHSMSFSLIPNCVVHWLGPITMHRVGRDGIGIVNFPQLGVQEGDVVVLAFGEIDARCHIGKQSDLTGKSWDEVVEDLVHRYLYTILVNRLFYTNLDCAVLSATPPANFGDCPDFPFYGPLEHRCEITRRLNRRLAEVAAQVGIGFLNVYPDYANPNGTLNYDFSDGGVHIRPACDQFIRDKLTTYLKTIRSF